MQATANKIHKHRRFMPTNAALVLSKGGNLLLGFILDLALQTVLFVQIWILESLGWIRLQSGIRKSRMDIAITAHNGAFSSRNKARNQARSLTPGSGGGDDFILGGSDSCFYLYCCTQGGLVVLLRNHYFIPCEYLWNSTYLKGNGETEKLNTSFIQCVPTLETNSALGPL